MTVLEEIGLITGFPPRVEFGGWRPGDQRWFVADTRDADAALSLAPRKPWRQGLRDLSAWFAAEQQESMASARQAEPRVAAL